MDSRIDALNVLRAVADAVRIQGSTSYTWFGTKVAFPAAAEVRRKLPEEVARTWLVRSLTATLYAFGYCKGKLTAFEHEAQTEPSTSSDVDSFAKELSSANQGSGYWDSGWLTTSTSENGQAVVERGGLRVWVLPSDYRRLKSVGKSERARVALRMPPGSQRLSPGFYTAIGNVDLERSQDIVRLYWHLTPMAAIEWLTQVTSLLNGQRVPFRAKLLNDPRAFSRADAGVLYVPRAAWPIIAPSVAVLYGRVKEHMRPAVPLFTKWLAPGLAAADDPQVNQSFGLHRCSIVAEALCGSHFEGVTGGQARVTAMVDGLIKAGVSLGAPHLSSGNKHDYHSIVPVLTKGSAGAPKRADSHFYLEAAVRIGWLLSKQSVWSAGSCNWLAPDRTSADSRRGLALPAYAPLGPDLYSGTAGVGIYFAHLFEATGERWARTVAIGAIRQALERAREGKLAHGVGLYTGRLGIALAAVRIGALVANPALVEEASSHCTRWDERPDTAAEHDLLSGDAGAIVALLTLASALEDHTLVERAKEFGDRLLESAESTRRGLSWPSYVWPTKRNLTGLSHGASGIGLALLELASVTKMQHFGNAGRSAFEYERHCFDEAGGTWPDFRTNGQGSGKKHPTLGNTTYWCHGAPGITLARLRAFELTGDTQLLAEYRSGLAMTQTDLVASLHRGDGSYTLCHGLVGNADVDLECSRDVPTLQAATVPFQVGDKLVGAIDHASASGRSYQYLPDNPSLFLGLAGVGLFMMRLDSPQIPSVLLVRPDDWVLIRGLAL
jgi:hypothetical protein